MEDILKRIEELQEGYKSKLEHILPELTEIARGVPSEESVMLFPLPPESEGWHLRHPPGGSRVFSNMVKPWASSFWIDVAREDVLSFAKESYIRAAVIAQNAYNHILEKMPLKFARPMVLKEYEEERDSHYTEMSTLLEPLMEFTTNRARAAEVMCGAYHIFPGILPDIVPEKGLFLSIRGNARSIVTPEGSMESTESFRKWLSEDPLRLSVVLHNIGYHAQHPYIGNPM